MEITRGASYADGRRVVRARAVRAADAARRSFWGRRVHPPSPALACAESGGIRQGLIADGVAARIEALVAKLIVPVAAGTG